MARLGKKLLVAHRCYYYYYKCGSYSDAPCTPGMTLCMYYVCVNTTYKRFRYRFWLVFLCTFNQSHEATAFPKGFEGWRLKTLAWSVVCVCAVVPISSWPVCLSVCTYGTVVTALGNLGLKNWFGLKNVGWNSSFDRPHHPSVLFLAEGLALLFAFSLFVGFLGCFFVPLALSFLIIFFYHVIIEV